MISTSSMSSTMSYGMSFLLGTGYRPTALLRLSPSVLCAARGHRGVPAATTGRSCRERREGRLSLEGQAPFQQRGEEAQLLSRSRSPGGTRHLSLEAIAAASAVLGEEPHVSLLGAPSVAVMALARSPPCPPVSPSRVPSALNPRHLPSFKGVSAHLHPATPRGHPAVPQTGLLQQRSTKNKFKVFFFSISQPSPRQSYPPSREQSEAPGSALWSEQRCHAGAAGKALVLRRLQHPLSRSSPVRSRGLATSRMRAPQLLSGVKMA